MSDYKEIALTQGKVAIVDAADFTWLNQWKWHAYRGKEAWYARRTDYSGEKPFNIRMHRLIMGEPNGMEVDHCDGDGLNNRRSNLRIVTTNQNQWNRRLQRNNRSGHPGVSWRTDQNVWQAQLSIDGKHKFLGRFKDKALAIAAYQKAAAERNGDFVCPMAPLPAPPEAEQEESNG